METNVSPLPQLHGRVFLIPLITSESRLMYARWASLMGICQEILGVTMEDWIGPFHAGEVSGPLFLSDVLTSISVDTI
jgi:hypothetical protein